jgi:hypothetical protein
MYAAPPAPQPTFSGTQDSSSKPDVGAGGAPRSAFLVY